MKEIEIIDETEIIEEEVTEGESPLNPSEETEPWEDIVIEEEEPVIRPEDEPIIFPDPPDPIDLSGEIPDVTEVPPVIKPEPQANTYKEPTDKMLVFHDGNYEVGDWLHSQSYPDSDMPYYILDLGNESDKALAATIEQLFPFVSLDIENGEIVGAQEREKTQEEIDKEDETKQSDPVRRIGALEVTSSEIKEVVADTVVEVEGVKQEGVIALSGLAEAYLLIYDLMARLEIMEAKVRETE